MKIQRRHFLFGTLGVAALAGLGFAGGRALSEHEIIAAVRRRLDFLTLDEAGLRAYASDQMEWLLAKRPTLARIRTRASAIFTRSVKTRQWRISSDTRSRRALLEDHLTTIYLLSSDFFISGADETRVVNYIALYDPMRPCGNPFARPPPDPGAGSAPTAA